MAEQYNFTKNLRRIVAPPLRARGFTNKGTSFTRVADGSLQVIFFQRSLQANTLHGSFHHLSSLFPDATREQFPAVFYVNLSLRFDVGRVGHLLSVHPDTRLANPLISKSRAPSPGKGFENCWNQLSREEQLKFLWAPRADEWTYGSEEELCSRLSLAVDEVIRRGIPYLESVSKIIYQPDCETHIKELQDRVNA